MQRWGALMLIAVALAGCTNGGGEPNEIETAGEDDRPLERSTAAGGPTATPVAASPPPDGPSASNDSLSIPVTTTLPLYLNGSFKPFVEGCVWDPVQTVCPSIQPAGSENGLPIEVIGTVTRIALTLSWDAGSPAAATLGMSLEAFTDSDVETIVSADGPSPVTLALEEPFELRDGFSHRIRVWMPYQGPVGNPGAGVAATVVEQPFAVAGELFLTAPANP